MSDLLKIARATNDDRFRWRVGAAMVLQAQIVYTSQTAKPADKLFALSAINSPQSPDVAMLALVASDPAVVAKVTLVDDIVPNTSDVADADIRRVVAAMWSAVAAKFVASAGNAGTGGAQ